MLQPSQWNISSINRAAAEMYPSMHRSYNSNYLSALVWFDEFNLILFQSFTSRSQNHFDTGYYKILQSSAIT